MKTNCIILVSALFLFSCQREITYPEFEPAPPAPPVPDSITLVESVVATNFDKNNNLLWKSRQMYDYDFANRKSVITFTDSTGQSVRTYTETFSYDMHGKLTLYETTNTLVYFTKAEFRYKTNGDIDKAIFHLVTGELLENSFKHATMDGLKIITLYDTTRLGERHTGYRPQMIRYSFDQSDRLVEQLEFSTGPNKDPAYWMKDTFDYKFSHNALDISKMSLEYSYLSNGTRSATIKDSVVFFRESQGSELYDSYKMIYKNLYWLSFSEYLNNSFANSMVHNAFYPNYLYYFRNPVQRIEYWSAVNFPIYTTSVAGDFINTFDSKGRLVKAVYPKRFGHAYDAWETLEYTYKRIPK